MGFNNNSITYIQTQINELEKKIAESQKILEENDETLKLLAQEELESLKSQKENLKNSLKAIKGDYTNPPDNTRTDSNSKPASGDVIIEVRAGAGGDEAGLFANDLFTMYSKYAEKHGWNIQLINKNGGGIGNIKEVLFEVIGKGSPTPYRMLQFESGVHRVQRVPSTESSGRIHTSTATVAVLPIVTEVEVEIKPEDLRIDTYRSGGAGGQHVNKTDSAIRITHIPSGIIATCQDERSQHKNRERAMSLLRSRLFNTMQKQQKKNINELRADQVGTGERSEKIRTYNFPQDRITDHRIKKNWHNMEKILAGEIEKMLSDVVTELSAT